MSTTANFLVGLNDQNEVMTMGPEAIAISPGTRVNLAVINVITTRVPCACTSWLSQIDVKVKKLTGAFRALSLGERWAVVVYKLYQDDNGIP